MKKILINVITLTVFLVVVGLLATKTYDNEEITTNENINEYKHNVSLNVTYTNGETEVIITEYISPCENDVIIRLSGNGCVEIVSDCVGANEIKRVVCGVRKYEIYK